MVYADVTTGTGNRDARMLEEVVGGSGGGDGEYVQAVAGSGSTLVYSVLAESYTDGCIYPGTPCEHSVGGRVMRVVGRNARRIRGLPPSLDLAVGGGRIAVVAAAPTSPDWGAVPSGWIEVHDASTGALAARFQPAGKVLELAVSREVVALLVSSGGRRQIERRDAATGALLGTTPVFPSADDLSVSGRRVVFRTGRVLRLLDAATGTSRMLTARRVVPVDPSIEDRRVVWGENARGRGRVLALLV
jgi:hypothetical protein